MAREDGPGSGRARAVGGEAGRGRAAAGNAFGTFGGVFTPSILTILGVIMFMRASFVLGNAGILQAIAILLCAKGITLTTGLSLSAIGSNMQVRGGGAFFIISRVLGPELGGAIGLALFLALALSVPFYILGFAEAVLGMGDPRALWVTLVTAVLLLGVSFVGARWAIRIRSPLTEKPSGRHWESESPIQAMTSAIRLACRSCRGSDSG